MIETQQLTHIVLWWHEYVGGHYLEAIIVVSNHGSLLSMGLALVTPIFFLISLI